MTGFTVTDEAVRAVAAAVHEDFVAHAFDGEVCNHETDVDYSCKDLMMKCVRAALEAAARTAQPKWSDLFGMAPDLPAEQFGIEPHSQLTATREKLTEALREFADGEPDGDNGWVLFADELTDFADALLASGVVQEASAQPTPVVDVAELAAVASKHMSYTVETDPLDHRQPFEESLYCICDTSEMLAVWVETEPGGDSGSPFKTAWAAHVGAAFLAAGVFKTEAEVRAALVEEILTRVRADFSGDEYEENAIGAAQEDEWSWFRWLAVTAVERAAAIRAGEQA